MTGAETSNIVVYPPWTSEKVQEIRELASEGLSARQIGDKVGRTRNSIIGKLRRMGIPLLNSKGPMPRRRSTMIKPKNTVNALKRQRNRRPPTVWNRPVAAEIVPVNGGAGVTLLELGRDECHSVVGSTRPATGLPHYCGLPTWNETAYCVDHYAMFHRPTPPKR